MLTISEAGALPVGARLVFDDGRSGHRVECVVCAVSPGALTVQFEDRAAATGVSLSPAGERDWLRHLTPVALPGTLALKVEGERTVLALACLADAPIQWERLVDFNNWFSSDAPRAWVIDTGTGRKVARISYNGRLWHPKTGAEL